MSLLSLSMLFIKLVLKMVNRIFVILLLDFLVAVTSLMIMQKYGCRMISPKIFMMLLISKIMLL
ncbi:hypothetical protein DWY95_08705 [Faecalibacterium sp. AF28-13AC]|nr:hypothetical protein DWY95_08705 [Faecalibacterium sp. AF28-13AC]